MDTTTIQAFLSEFTDIQKLAVGGANIPDLLARKAARKGLDVSRNIQQVRNIMGAGNKTRAAEVARNVSGFLSGRP